MKKITLKIIVTVQIVFLILVTVFFIHHRLNLPRIVIVHSYDVDNNWVQQINQGLQEVFTKQPNVVLNFQYLNSQNDPSTSYMQRVGMLVRRVIDHIKPSIIIAVDDDAQDYVAKFYVNNPDTTIIFCAINAEPDEYGYDTAKNVSGVTERIPIDALKKIIPYLPASEKQPGSLKIIALGDHSKTNKFNKKYFESFDWGPVNLIDTILIDNFDDWKTAVTDSNQRADCILLTIFSEIQEHSGSGKYLPADTLIKWTEQNTTIPVIGCSGEFVLNGGSVAITPSGYEQGNIAARYALKILNGADISTLPVLSTLQYLVYMRTDAAKNFPRLPTIYEEFARGIGKFYDNL